MNHVTNRTEVKNMDSPPSVLRGRSRRFVGEASPRLPRNREAGKRHTRHGYTSVAPPISTPMLTRDRVTTAYDDHYAAVRYIATREFRVPDADADQLIHDVYVAFIRHHATV